MLNPRRSTSDRVVAALGCGVIVTSSLAVVGYMLNIPFLYLCVGSTGMAFNTAVCFQLIGITLIILARGNHQTGSPNHDAPVCVSPKHGPDRGRSGVGGSGTTGSGAVVVVVTPPTGEGSTAS